MNKVEELVMMPDIFAQLIGRMDFTIYWSYKVLVRMWRNWNSHTSHGNVKWHNQYENHFGNFFYI